MSAIRSPRRPASPSPVLDAKPPASGGDGQMGQPSTRAPVAPPAVAIEYAALSTSAASRPHNEDRWQVAAEAGLFAIADGISSYNAGEVAAELAVQTACQLLPDLLAHGLEPPEALRRAFAACNDEIREFAGGKPDCVGMATTLVCALIVGNRLHLAHVGDSRAYVLRAGRLQRMTRDHSIGQEIVEAGRMTEGQVTELPARGILTRAVGLADVVEPELSHCAWGPEDSLLLCSDGLTTALGDPVIEHLMLETGGRGPAAQVRALIGGALQTGGLANVTALVAMPCQRSRPRPSRANRGGSDADRTH